MKKVIYLLVFILSMLILNSSINAWNEYTVGQEVEYNGIKFYVIKDSSSGEDSVTMLKKEPLTVDEVNLYGGVGTDANHVNMYVTDDSTASYYQTAKDQNGYGGMAYYSSATCGYIGSSGCTTSYANSEIKYVVDAWKADQAPQATEARLIAIDEVTSLGYEWSSWGVSDEGWVKTEDTPAWLYNNDYWYWTGSQYNDSSSRVWSVNYDGGLSSDSVYTYNGVVRPVIVLSKSALGDIDDSEEDNNQDIVPDDKGINNITPSNNEDTKNELKTSVKVDNTYMSKSIVIIILGFISAELGIFAYYKFSNKRK